MSDDHVVLKHCLSLGVQGDFVWTNASRIVTLATPDNERDGVLIPEKSSRDKMNERLCPEECGEIWEERSLMFSALPKVI